ncbi:MAG: 2-oxoglutarate dehydrogenase E1 component [Parachlamydiaceae bacterium]|nr:2-oxoglutarate dehydrogenase E1 component [Parachlamydiaceae bacterium]
MELDAFIDSGFLNLSFIEELYTSYKSDPNSVDVSWKTMFAKLENPISISQGEGLHAKQSTLQQPETETDSTGDLRIFNLINAYRTYGHLQAKTNPLETNSRQDPHQLSLEISGFSENDLALRFPSGDLFNSPDASLADIITALKAIYCGSIGVEYMGFLNPELETWLQQHIEPSRFKNELSLEEKQMILQHLNKSELFESFLHTKYVGQKRFSLEGGETLIPILASLIDIGASLGIEEFILGMAHRGRLNVLCNILDKSYADIFSEFEEGHAPLSVEGSGDVKYHKGFNSETKTVHGHKIKIILTPNPSHLEAVGPVVEGQVRARQDLRTFEKGQNSIIPILIHGDAALSGQGVVYETLQMYKLEGYKTGGTIHIVVNNQIGFTTIPEDARSTTYCTDIARAFGAPIFHVNVEDPEGCIYATHLAVELRQKFHCDVFIELNCYRKYGHNEGDEPAFTQPLEYQQIRKKRPVRELYRDYLVQQGVLKEKAESLENDFKKGLQDALHDLKTLNKAPAEKVTQQLPRAKDNGIFQHVQTGVPRAILQQVAERICFIPNTLTVHPKLAALTKERLSMIKEDKDARLVDWGMAELLAYGTLLWEGNSVRLSGQDSCRGTFSHRHAMLMDQVKEQGYIPLQHLKPDQGHFDVFNSFLSEYAVLGFEFGYSIANPDCLVIWEAQFGDFANGAQIIIDQFISTAEQKWNQKFDLTLLLPHGYEGQGPEHSSARIERFLTLAGDNNMQIVQPTTPAQFFHVLRRQMLRELRKPLIVFTPKGLLRHPSCVSKVEDFTQGSFLEILDDPMPSKKPKKLVLCSGRIYYDLIAIREKKPTASMAIIRFEQLYPLDVVRIKDLLEKYAGFEECFWVQDEPSNMGAWDFIRPLLRELMPKGIDPIYIGRQRSASPATGSHAMHKQENTNIINALFGKEEPTIFEIAGQRKS